MTGSGASATVSARSATGNTEVTLVAELSARIESVTADFTPQILASAPSAAGLTIIVTVVISPGFRLPRLQVTTLPVSEQLPCCACAETKVALGPRRLVSTTAVAVEGPLLVIVMV